MKTRDEFRRYERVRAAALRAGPAAGSGRTARWAAWGAYRLDPPPRTGSTTTHHRPPNPLRPHRDRDRDPDRDRRPGQIRALAAVAVAVLAVWCWVLGGVVVAVAVTLGWWWLVPRLGPIRPRRLALAGWASLAVALAAWAVLASAGIAATIPGPAGIPVLTSPFIPVAVLAWTAPALWVAAWVCRHVLGWTPAVVATTTRAEAVAAVVPADPDPDPDRLAGDPGDPFAFLDFDDDPESESAPGAPEVDPKGRS